MTPLHHHTVRSLAAGAVMAALLCGCTDDQWRQTPDMPDNVVRMAASIAPPVTVSRGPEEQELHKPLVVCNDADTLYLHTYVGDRSRVEWDDEPQGRGEEVNCMADFRRLYRNFGVHITYKDATPFADPTVTDPVAETDPALWIATDQRLRWPSESMLSFAAWAPATRPEAMTNVRTSPGVVSFDYVTPKGDNDDDAMHQPDILWAVSDCNRSRSIDGAAPLTFRHALSAIKFAVRDVVEGEIVNIKLLNVYGAGHCTYVADSDEDNVCLRTGTYTWNGHTAVSSYSQDFHVKVSSTTGVSNPEDVVITDELPSATFMMIPQVISEEAMIEVTMRRKDALTGNFDDVVMRGRILDNLVREWLPGKEYIYTISTTTANWIYIFKVSGNHNNNTEIWTPAPTSTLFLEQPDIYQNKAYHNVTSYRYRADNHAVRELLPWTAYHGNGIQYMGDELQDIQTDSTIWIKDRLGLQGPGSFTPERHDLDFKTHSVRTDWPGDSLMQSFDPYTGNTRSNPWDLSVFGDNNLSLNTANCYVVDRAGWYTFPLYYGNVWTNGEAIASSYIYQGTNGSVYDSESSTRSKILKHFTNHNGQPISSAPIQGAVRAELVWEDAYNIIDTVQLLPDQNKVLFHVQRENLQQGNAVIAIYNSAGVVLWSWHIWANEHWLNPQGLSNAFSESGFKTFMNPDNKMREQGDLWTRAVEAPAGENIEYCVAPYNLGWCDAKDVYYLKRINTMHYTQYMPDGTTVVAVAQLPIIQEGDVIKYRVGNNTYYQQGRKDPFVGFRNYSNVVKTNFGPRQYRINRDNPLTIAGAIDYPNVLFCGGDESSGDLDISLGDWLKHGMHYMNLWNNYPTARATSKWNYNAPNYTDAYLYHTIKTVYDPCPAGYMVPPGALFKFIGKGSPSSGNSWGNMNFQETRAKFETELNGWIHDSRTFKIYPDPTHKVKPSQDAADYNIISLTSTGHRWYSIRVISNHVWNPGDNFNSHLVYLWSSNISDWVEEYGGWGLALGCDEPSGEYDAIPVISDNSHYGLCAFFHGRRSMARPVRPIRITTTR